MHNSTHIYPCDKNLIFPTLQLFIDEREKYPCLVFLGDTSAVYSEQIERYILYKGMSALWGITVT